MIDHFWILVSLFLRFLVVLHSVSQFRDHRACVSINRMKNPHGHGVCYRSRCRLIEREWFDVKNTHKRFAFSPLDVASCHVASFVRLLRSSIMSRSLLLFFFPSESEYLMCTAPKAKQRTPFGRAAAQVHRSRIDDRLPTEISTDNDNNKAIRTDLLVRPKLPRGAIVTTGRNTTLTRSLRGCYKCCTINNSMYHMHAWVTTEDT